MIDSYSWILFTLLRVVNDMEKYFFFTTEDQIGMTQNWICTLTKLFENQSIGNRFVGKLD